MCADNPSRRWLSFLANWAIAVTAIWLSAGVAAADPPPKPEVASHFPQGIQRGGAASIALRGKNLQDVKEVKTSSAAITAKVVENSADLVKLELNAADAPLGAVEIWLITPGGETAKRKVFVDALPQTAEAEPNPPAAPNSLSMEGGVWGVLSQQGDMDNYRFAAAKGQTIVLELAAASLGSKLNGVLTIFDTAGRVLATSNDFDGDADALLAFTAPRDGQYTVQVGDLQIAGSGEHTYRLTAGTFPYVVGCYPPSVPAEKETEVELVGFNLPPSAKSLVKAGAGGEAAVPIDPAFRARKSLTVVVSAKADVPESEPNDAAEKATAMTIPGAAVGRIGSGGDADLFRMTAKKGEKWVLETSAFRRSPPSQGGAGGGSSPVDTRIEVLDAQGQPVPRLLLQATRDSYIDFRPIDSRSADIRVANWEEMDLNEYLYLQGEVCKLFRAPQGPDSGFVFYQAANSQRRCYFDTSGSAHALGEGVYIVQPLAPGSTIIPSGLPVFTLYYANDDDGERTLGSDSKLIFTAPADGDYLVRVTDDRGLGGDRFVYRLIARAPEPDFSVSVGGQNPTINAASGKEITFTAERRDGFEGEIEIEFTGLPPGFGISSPIKIETGHLSTKATLFAEPSATAPTEENAKLSKVTAKAKIGDHEVAHEAGSLGTIKLAEKPQLVVRLEPAELTIKPGTTITAMLKIERNGLTDPVRFDVNNLPHGIIVDNIGLSGVLIPPGATERQIFITARPWVADTSRPCHAVAQAAGNQASPPLMLHVRAK